MEKMRIAKYIARCGVCSRREAEALIAAGRVAVNEEIISLPQTLVEPSDKIRIDNELIDSPQEAKLWLYNKPNGVLVTRHDPQGRPTIFNQLPKSLPHLMPVGRLDMNSEGLLLLTNDGDLARKLELPASGLVRVYKCRVFGKIPKHMKEELSCGITIDKVRYAPIKITAKKDGKNSWLTVELTEGKNREIRKVMAHFGLQVNRLIRIKYGNFELRNLQSNEIIELAANKKLSI